MSDQVFVARRIHTLDPARPQATHLAVRNGRVLATGSERDAAHWGIDAIDRRFADKVLVPGFVEGHSHLAEGAIWSLPYVGYFPRRAPDGRRVGGFKSIEAVLAALGEHEATLADPEAPLLAWGFDPIYFPGARFSRLDLDRVSATRPVVVLHANLHVVHANSSALARAGLGAETTIDGVVRDAGGALTGELQETHAVFALLRGLRLNPFAGGSPLGGPIAPEVLYRFARSGQIAGCTTITDLFNNIADEAVASFRAITAEDDFPVRLAVAANTAARPIDEGIAALRQARTVNTDKLHLGIAKVITDGSIQGFTARLRSGRYHNGAANGLWNQDPDQLLPLVDAYHRAGLQLFFHTNGDEASERVLDILETVITAAPRPDHRHTLQHAQLMDEAQLRRAATLGVGVNLFANHIYYWGEQHRTRTVGPERAATMNAVATALRLGVSTAIHSDAPVTPIGPLFSAWCAVNRLTADGAVLGDGERITAAQALTLITLGAARSLHLDHLVGSLEPGKLADLAVLDTDPLESPAAELKDIGIPATVLGGRVFATPAP